LRQGFEAHIDSGASPPSPTGNLPLCPVPKKILGTPKISKSMDGSYFLEFLRIHKGLAIFANGKFAPSLRGYFQKVPYAGAGVEPLRIAFSKYIRIRRLI
jgi:hypothetical protein